MYNIPELQKFVNDNQINKYYSHVYTVHFFNENHFEFYTRFCNFEKIRKTLKLRKYNTGDVVETLPYNIFVIDGITLINIGNDSYVIGYHVTYLNKNFERNSRGTDAFIKEDEITKHYITRIKHKKYRNWVTENSCWIN